MVKSWTWTSVLGAALLDTAKDTKQFCPKVLPVSSARLIAAIPPPLVLLAPAIKFNWVLGTTALPLAA